MIINCKEIATNIKERLKPLVSKDKGLAIIQAGDNPASSIYVKNKIKDCEELGVPTTLKHFDPINTIADAEILELEIKQLNNNPNIKGIIVQLPIEGNISPDLVGEILNTIADEKDVDGFKATSKYIPATPKGIITILSTIEEDLTGLHVVLIGRGKTVGEPLIPLLLKKNATLTVCHSRSTKADIMKLCQSADIIISATGQAESLTKDFIGDNHYPYIIDVGISRINGKQVGDVAKELHDITPCTPWTNGIGLMTRVSLLQNLLEE